MFLHARFSLRALVSFLLMSALTVGVLVATPSAAHAQKIRPDFWGMHVQDWSRLPDAFPAVGAANFTTSGTYWSAIEPTAGSYDWAALAAQVQGAESIKAKPMIVLGRTPRHASTVPESDDYADYMPRMKAWKRYVSTVVKKYGARLDYQIWPEPNIKENWKGTPREMAQLTVVAAKVIHKHAKKAKVVSPAVALRMRAQRAWMVKYFKQSVGGKPVHRYIDAIAVDPFPEKTGTPEDAFKLMQQAKKELKRIGVRGVPIWNNEINYGVEGGGQATDVELPVDVQQSYVIRTYALSAAAGMARTYWMSWDFSLETMAVMMSAEDGRRLEPGRSYEVVRSWLNGTRFEGCKTLKSGVWQCTAIKGRKKRQEVRRIYWKPKGSAKISIPRSTKHVANQDGEIKGRKGASKIKVTYRPIMVATKK